jgi:hypothetical protein
MFHLECRRGRIERGRVPAALAVGELERHSPSSNLAFGLFLIDVRLVYCMASHTTMEWMMHSPVLLEYLRKHTDALIALSHDSHDREVAAKIRELADECRIMLSLMDISDVTAGLNKPLARAGQY